MNILGLALLIFIMPMFIGWLLFRFIIDKNAYSDLKKLIQEKKNLENFKDKDITKDIFEKNQTQNSELSVLKPDFFSIIINASKVMPATLSIREHVSLLKEQFQNFASNIISYNNNYKELYSEFTKIAILLGAMIPFDKIFGPMLANPTLTIEPHVNEDLNKYFQGLVSSAQINNLSDCHYNLMLLNRKFSEFTNLNKNWLSLRDIAAKAVFELSSQGGEEWEYFKKCFAEMRQTRVYRPKQEGEKGYGWLGHGVRNFFSFGGKDFVWFPWRVFWRPERLDALCKWVVKEIEDKQWEFNVICPMSSTSLPLASLLFTRLTEENLDLKEKIRLIPIDDGKYKFLPNISLNENEDRVLLVDAAFQTGTHLYEAKKELDRLNIGTAGFVTIFYNDLLPQFLNNGEIKINVKQLLENEIKEIIYLFKISDIYQQYKKRINDIL